MKKNNQQDNTVHDYEQEVQICDMFDNVSEKYDLLNKILSFGINCIWRKELVKQLQQYKPAHVLDIATGTGNQAIRIAKLKPESITALDISMQMLHIGQKKIKKRKLDKLIDFKHGSCSQLPFEDESFDTVTISFGVRNFNDPLKALKEAYRVTKKNGVIMILEFGIPKNPLIKLAFLFHFTKLLPLFGGLLTGNKAAFSYLTNSVKKFPYGYDFLTLLDKAGFTDLEYKKRHFGITYIYSARKKSFV